MILGQLEAKFGGIEWSHVLRFRWPWILLAASAAMLAGAVARKGLPKLHEATARIELAPEAGIDGIAPGAHEFRPVWQNDLRREAAELESRSLLAEVVAPCDLVRRWGMDSDASALATLAERLRVEIVPSEHALLLSVRDLDREHAADLANAIGNRFVARKDSEVRAEANARVRRLGQERDAAARDIEALEARLIEMGKAGEASPVELAGSRQQLITLRHLHHSLEAKHQLALLEAGEASTPARVAVPAAPDRSRPIRSPWLGLPVLFLLGLSLGFLAVLVAERGSGRWEAVADLMTKLGVPVAGFAPLTKVSPVTVREFPDAWIEPYRDLRNRLLRLPTGDCLLLALMPARRGDGDSVAEVAANLGCVFADAGRTTLVIDADFRAPKLNGFFDAARHPGLSDFLSGEMRLEETVVRARRPNLWFLPAGPLPGDPGGLLNGRRMTELARDLRSRFDCVLLVSPSLLDVSDGGLLAGIADCTVVATSCAGHPFKRLREAKTALETVPAAMGGVILTKRLPSVAEQAPPQAGLPDRAPLARSR